MGSSIATIAGIQSLQMEADVSELNLSRDFAGQRCRISLDSVPGRSYNGIVDNIVPTVDRAKATVLTKIHFTDIDTQVITGMGAKVAYWLKEDM